MWSVRQNSYPESESPVHLHVHPHSIHSNVTGVSLSGRYHLWCLRSSGMTFIHWCYLPTTLLESFLENVEKSWLDYQGIITLDMDNASKAVLLACMKFTAKHGCKLLHEFMEDSMIVWFGNVNFASILKRSLYDITCLGWCGAWGDMQLLDANMVCQLTEPSPYIVASQITWVSCSGTS